MRIIGAVSYRRPPAPSFCHNNIIIESTNVFIKLVVVIVSFRGDYKGRKSINKLLALIELLVMVQIGLLERFEEGGRSCFGSM